MTSLLHVQVDDTNYISKFLGFDKKIEWNQLESFCSTRKMIGFANKAKKKITTRLWLVGERERFVDKRFFCLFT